MINRLEKQENTKKSNTPEQQNIATFVFRIPFAGVQGETLIKNLVRKLKRHLDKPFKLKNIYVPKS